ncbi:MAG TPA: flagellar basal body rod protein FlgC [Stellaceae bacterium]|nr:flagellar basal body rod protein FlgC [Stellaceae bacterium]
MELDKSFAVAYSGLSAETQRLKVIAENLANADSTAQTPDQDPYKRQIVNFEDVFDRQLGVDKVKVSGVTTIQTGFGRRYEPGHPAADASGYVKTPNVNSITELMDMREAQRSYEANLNVISAAKSMLSRTLDLLRG